MLKISNRIITRVITVKYSIASPPNLMSRGKYPLKIKGLTAYLYIGSPYSVCHFNILRHNMQK